MLTCEHQNRHDQAEDKDKYQHIAGGSPCAACCVQGGEQAEPYRHDSGSDDRQNAVTADPAYDLATNDGSYEDAAHHRRELETRSGWANPLHHLKVDRHICHGAKHHQTDDEADSEIGRAHVCTPVTTSPLVSSLMLEKK